MTKEEKQRIKHIINNLVYSLDYARNLDEAYEIEQDIIALENMLYNK